MCQNTALAGEHDPGHTKTEYIDSEGDTRVRRVIRVHWVVRVVSVIDRNMWYMWCDAHPLL